MVATRFSARADQALRNLALFFCAVLSANYPLRGGETSDAKSTTTASAEEESPEGKNWIELGIGGLIIKGDAAQFKQAHRMSGDVFGGIQDLHYEQALGKKGQFSIDGHAIFDNHDYDVKVELSQPDVGYIRAGYTEFRSWYDGNGGFFPINGQFFPPPHPEMHIDRGEAWVELGLRLPNWPEITLHYSHQFRDGQKDVSIRGDAALTGILPPVTNQRKIAPAFRDIDETRDIFVAEIVKNFGKTDINLGMRYEHTENDRSLQLWRGAGQFATILPPPPQWRIVGPNGNAAAERFITQREKLKNDIFNGHAISETHFSDSLWFTSAYAYSTLGSDLSGSRIIGTRYNSMFGEPVPTLQSNDHEVLNLAGTSQVQEHVFNANLLWMPLKDLNVIGGFRYTHEEKESDSTYLDSNTAANTAPFTQTNPQGGFQRVASIPKSNDTFDRLNNFAERLELRYTGIANWLFYVEGEWDEEFGDVHEHELGGVLVAGVPVSVDQGNLNKDTNLLGQKYTAGATWYPMTRLNVAAQYYHKIADYDNDFHTELATQPVPGAERNQRLLGQDWHTDNFNVRITLRPKIPAYLGTVTFVSRYDFVGSSAEGKWAISPTQTGASPTGTILDEVRSALITKHIFSESISWNPMARLYFQSNVSVALDQTKTGASNVILIPNTTATLRVFRNDYWTVSAGGGYIIDDKTEVRADYIFYRANNYFNNALVALPYGMGATEHTVSASMSRQIAKNVRLKLQYSYFNYTDQLSGGHNNYEAHAVFSSLQFRF